MELGCPSLPYEPFIYFVNSQGLVPSEGMAFDVDNGVTVLAVLRAAPGFDFTEPTQWAVVTDFEMQQKALSFSDLHDGLFQGDAKRAAFLRRTSWCYLRTGTFDARGVTRSKRTW